MAKSTSLLASGRRSILSLKPAPDCGISVAMHLHSLFQGAHAFLAVPDAVAGVSADAAASKPNGAFHSIAEIVAHMGFWQRWFLGRCDGLSVPMPSQASLGWPTASRNDWDSVREQFEADYRRALALADDGATVDLPLTPAIEFTPLAHYTIGDALMHIALHNAHHLGQVITLRQQVGQWPPPAGSWTW